MSNVEIILFVAAMFFIGMWLGIYICIIIDDHT